MILHRDRLKSCRYNNNNYNDRIIIMYIFTISSEPLMNGLRRVFVVLWVAMRVTSSPPVETVQYIIIQFVLIHTIFYTGCSRVFRANSENDFMSVSGVDQLFRTQLMRL